MKFTLPTLSYSYSALEPYIDAQTMEIHHTKHHQTYVDKLNAVIEKNPSLEGKSLEELMEQIDALGLTDADKNALKNHGGGHLNHTFFWTIMGPEKKLNEGLIEKITTTFGSMDAFKELFETNALNRFGSGWSWLVEDKSGNLLAYSTANQDSPYLQGHKPIIGLDVWEHAYYLKYQNKRPDYVKNWWNVLTVL